MINMIYILMILFVIVFFIQCVVKPLALAMGI